MSKLFLGIAALAIIVFVFLMMGAFTSANVTIIPKKETVSFNLALNISKTISASTTVSNNLKYEVIELKKEGEREVAANGEERVERKASGKIVVYNDFDREPQRLIARTRFATPEGLIFRIADSVTVPGKQGSAPSSIEVTIYADEAGEKYNVGMKDFTIPGFKSDPARYKGFYARSKTEIAGGLVGNVKKVATLDKEKAFSEIRSSLEADLKKDVSAKVPENLVVLDGSTIFDLKELPQQDVSGSKALVRAEATVYAIAFDKKDLAEAIKKQFLVSWEGIPASIASFEDMALVFDDATWKPSMSDSTPIKLSGEALFVAFVDEEVIKNAISGKNKGELSTIVNDSPAIESATAALRPLWKSSFPENLSKIKVEIQNQD